MGSIPPPIDWTAQAERMERSEMTLELLQNTIAAICRTLADLVPQEMADLTAEKPISQQPLTE